MLYTKKLRAYFYLASGNDPPFHLKEKRCLISDEVRQRFRVSKKLHAIQQWGFFDRLRARTD